jgi:hypothetical protein
VTEIENLWTPAHQAIEDGDLEALAWHLDSGANPNEECCGLTLLEHAVDYEADVAAQGGGRMGIGLLAVLLAYGASPKIHGRNVGGPLQIAIDYRHEMARRLIQRFM